MTPIEVEPLAFVTDFTGQPGQRTFFVQARTEDRTFTYLLEKQQVAVLAEKLKEVLVLVDAADPVLTGTPARDPGLRLEAPIEPEWRIGTIGLSYDEAVGQVIVALHPVEEADASEEPIDPSDLEPDEFAVRFRLGRDQVRAFVLHALHVVAEGRPTCQLCGLPMDPEGHMCPASNGHFTEV